MVTANPTLIMTAVGPTNSHANEMWLLFRNLPMIHKVFNKTSISINAQRSSFHLQELSQSCTIHGGSTLTWKLEEQAETLTSRVYSGDSRIMNVWTDPNSAFITPHLVHQSRCLPSFRQLWVMPYHIGAHDCNLWSSFLLKTEGFADHHNAAIFIWTL